MTQEQLKNLSIEVIYSVWVDCKKRQESCCMVNGEVIEELYQENIHYIEKQGDIIELCVNELERRKGEAS